jgi:hypothetical protein
MKSLEEPRDTGVRGSIGHRHLDFRCFGYQQDHDLFVAECIDLNLMVKADTMNRAVSSLRDAIDGYLEVSFDGDPTGLVPRPSPVARRFLYRWIGVRSRLAQLFGDRKKAPSSKHFIYSTV